MKEDVDEVLTVVEAAKVLRLGKNSVYALCASGALPHRRIGTAIRLSRRAIMGWLEGHK